MNYKYVIFIQQCDYCYCNLPDLLASVTGGHLKWSLDIHEFINVKCETCQKGLIRARNGQTDTNAGLNVQKGEKTDGISQKVNGVFNFERFDGKVCNSQVELMRPVPFILLALEKTAAFNEKGCVCLMLLFLWKQPQKQLFWQHDGRFTSHRLISAVFLSEKIFSFLIYDILISSQSVEGCVGD